MSEELGFYSIGNEGSVIIFEQGNDMGNATIKRAMKNGMSNRLKSEGT